MKGISKSGPSKQRYPACTENVVIGNNQYIPRFEIHFLCVFGFSVQQVYVDLQADIYRKSGEIVPAFHEEGYTRIGMVKIQLISTESDSSSDFGFPCADFNALCICAV